MIGSEMRLRGTALILVLVLTVTAWIFEAQARAEEISEDELVLRELGLYEEEEADEPHTKEGTQKSSPVEHPTLSPRVESANEEHDNEGEIDDPWNLFEPIEPQAANEDEDEELNGAMEENDETDEEVGHEDKSSAEGEFLKLREKHNSNFFEGSTEYLERIVYETRSNPQEAAGPMSILGFHYIRRREYEQCASTFEGVDDVMGEVTEGPGLLMQFCRHMSKNSTSLGNLQNAVPLLRAAITSAKRELEEERVQVLNEHLAILSKRLSDARGDDDFGASSAAQRSVRWYVEGLEAKPFHDRRQFPGATYLETNFQPIKTETDAFLESQSVSREMRPMGEHTGGADSMLVLEGQWTDVSLFKGGVRNKRVCNKYFPKTCDIIEKGLPEAWTNNFCQVVISQLAPGTETRLHQGGTNAQLTIHLGLKAPPSAGLKVGDKMLEPGWSEGKAIVFDDSFEHQVWHRGDASEGARIVLVTRIWHPSFSLRERFDVINQDAFKMGSREVKKRSKYLESVEATRRYEELLAAFHQARPSARTREKEEL